MEQAKEEIQALLEQHGIDLSKFNWHRTRDRLQIAPLWGKIHANLANSMAFASLLQESQQTISSQQWDGISSQQLDEIVQHYLDRRRERSKSDNEIESINGIHESDQARLGTHLKLVNRDASTEKLLQHAASEYVLYATDGGLEDDDDFQLATCLGAPGIGKTTFSTRAFAESLRCTNREALWANVATADIFRPIVESCLEGEKQFQISFEDELSEDELDNGSQSLSHRILNCLTNKSYMDPVPFSNTPSLEELLLKLTNGDKTSMVVVILDDTSILLEMEGRGRLYLYQLLGAIDCFNRQQKGFVFCIVNGINVRALPDALTPGSRGPAPVTIPLPLLSNVDMVEVFRIWHIDQVKAVIAL